MTGLGRPSNTIDTVLAQVEVGDCWLWQGAVSSNGYGNVGVARQQWTPHRFVYTELVGVIPDGLELDHLCRAKLCCNPDHLEPVTSSENHRRGAPNGTIARQKAKTHCPRGHSYSGENLITNNKGHRWCRTCKVEAGQQRRREREARRIT